MSVEPQFAQRSVVAGVLDVAYLEAGRADGWPVVLIHGFPYDAWCFVDTATLLASEGARVIMPWVRGYGATRFLSRDTMRSGEQAAFGLDLRVFLDALGIERAVLGGFDWGGRAACVVAALWPERVAGLVTVGGYNITDFSLAHQPLPPEVEHRLWYIWYLQSHRGRAGLEANRNAFARLLWQLWSPRWDFTDAEFECSARAFDNPDFVDVVLHSYRHRHNLAPGDPALAELQERLADMPSITVPTVVIDCGSDGLVLPDYFTDISAHFVGPVERHSFERAGHNPAQEDPEAFARAILRAHEASRSSGSITSSRMDGEISGEPV